MFSLIPTSLFILLFPYALSQPDLFLNPKRTPNGFHLPIYQRKVSRLDRRGVAAGSIGLGDYQDRTYSVLINVGGAEMPVVLDTGSSDLWVISDACQVPSCLSSDIQRYPQASFQSSGLDAKLYYGDSQTPTHAFGQVGKDTAGVAGLSIKNQYFAAINDTNTTVSETDAAGIFGLGFPVNSVIWSQLFKSQFPIHGKRSTKRSNPLMNRFLNSNPIIGRSATGLRTARALPYYPNFRRTPFPDLRSLLPSRSATKRQSSSSSSPTLSDLLSTFATNGPLVPRLAQGGALSSPQFTITLQRDTIQVGGNVGMLSVGELPDGVSNDSLTWVPLRAYTPQQGGLDSPTDTYPIAWEIPIDDVFIDGQKLPQSQLAPGISVSALLDTGNSLIRGPKDVVQAMTTVITGSSTADTFDCFSAPHTLAFQIGGKMFPVDPRDFVEEAANSKAQQCQSNVIATDPPRDGFLYSWSLGDPFLKSNLVSFYFGNLTHPSVDPPRVGILSTVPSDAGVQYSAAVLAAQDAGRFPATTQAAPSSGPSMTTTINGVPQAPTISPSVAKAKTGGAKKMDAMRTFFSTPAIVVFVTCLFAL